MAENSIDTENDKVIKEIQFRLNTLDRWKERDITPEQREELTALLADIKVKVLGFQFGNGIF